MEKQNHFSGPTPASAATSKPLAEAPDARAAETPGTASTTETLLDASPDARKVPPDTDDSDSGVEADIVPQCARPGCHAHVRWNPEHKAVDEVLLTEMPTG